MAQFFFKTVTQETFARGRSNIIAVSLLGRTPCFLLANLDQKSGLLISSPFSLSRWLIPIQLPAFFLNKEKKNFCAKVNELFHCSRSITEVLIWPSFYESHVARDRSWIEKSSISLKTRFLKILLSYQLPGSRKRFSFMIGKRWLNG